MEERSEWIRDGLADLRLLLDSVRPSWAPNRIQQLLLAGAGALLLLLVCCPPWMAHVDGQNQFLGFYPILGGNPQYALHAGAYPVSLYFSLMLLLAGHVTAATVFLYAALALTREDWASLVVRYLTEKAPAGAADSAVDTLLASKVAAKETFDPVPSRDWNFAGVVVDEPVVPERATAVEQLVLRRAAEQIARGRTDSAESLLRRALHHAERRHGSEHPFVEELMFRLANLLRDTGRYTEAEGYYIDCVAQRETLYGFDDLRVATSFDSYASMMRMLGRPDAAERLHNLARSVRAKNQTSVQGSLPVRGDSPVDPGLVRPVPDAPISGDIPMNSPQDLHTESLRKN